MAWVAKQSVDVSGQEAAESYRRLPPVPAARVPARRPAPSTVAHTLTHPLIHTCPSSPCTSSLASIRYTHASTLVCVPRYSW